MYILIDIHLIYCYMYINLINKFNLIDSQILHIYKFIYFIDLYIDLLTLKHDRCQIISCY